MRVDPGRMRDVGPVAGPDQSEAQHRADSTPVGAGRAPQRLGIVRRVIDPELAAVLGALAFGALLTWPACTGLPAGRRTSAPAAAGASSSASERATATELRRPEPARPARVRRATASPPRSTSRSASPGSTSCSRSGSAWRTWSWPPGPCRRSSGGSRELGGARPRAVRDPEARRAEARLRAAADRLVLAGHDDQVVRLRDPPRPVGPEGDRPGAVPPRLAGLRLHALVHLRARDRADHLEGLRLEALGRQLHRSASSRTRSPTPATPSGRCCSSRGRSTSTSTPGPTPARPGGRPTRRRTSAGSAACGTRSGSSTGSTLARAHECVLRQRHLHGRCLLAVGEPVRFPAARCSTLYRAAFFYGTSRWIAWTVWAHVIHHYPYDLSWGGPHWVPAAHP